VKEHRAKRYKRKRGILQPPFAPKGDFPGDGIGRWFPVDPRKGLGKHPKKKERGGFPMFKTFGPNGCHTLVAGEVVNLAGVRINAVRSFQASTTLRVTRWPNGSMAVENDHFIVYAAEGADEGGKDLALAICQDVIGRMGLAGIIPTKTGIIEAWEVTGLNSPYASHVNLWREEYAPEYAAPPTASSVAEKEPAYTCGHPVSAADVAEGETGKARPCPACCQVEMQQIVDERAASS